MTKGLHRNDVDVTENEIVGLDVVVVIEVQHVAADGRECLLALLGLAERPQHPALALHPLSDLKRLSEKRVVEPDPREDAFDPLREGFSGGAHKNPGDRRAADFR